MDQDGRTVAVRRVPEIEVRDLYVREFVRSGTRVVQEQQYCIIPAALSRAWVRRSQQGIHFMLFQVGYQGAGDFLGENGPDFSAPLDMFWAVLMKQASEWMLPIADCVWHRHIRVFLPNLVERLALDRPQRHRSVRARGDKGQDLAPRVTVALLGVGGQVSIADKVLSRQRFLSEDPGTLHTSEA